MGELTDTFQGDTPHLIASIEALLDLDARGALVPHGVGGHARTLLASAATRLLDAARSEAQPSGYDGLRQALAEAIEFAEQDWQALTPEGDAMLDRWRTALTFTASLSDASPKPAEGNA